MPTSRIRKKTPSARKQKELTRVPAEEVLADPSFDEKNAWLALLQATTTTTVIGEDGKREQITVPDYRIRMAALTYLTDKRDGKPGQAARPGAENKAQPLEDPRLQEAVENLLPPART
jgi:hypothetical protein